MKYTFKILLTLTVVSFSMQSYAQKSSDVLLTINDEKITVDEFSRVYLKNLNLVQDEDQKNVSSYLELYKDYKLKIQEAYRLNLDHKESYIREIEGYRSQLAKNFMTDISVTDALVKEAYNRTVDEVNARHILIRLNDGSNPEDTLKAYNKVIEARKRIVSGEDFKKIAKQFSEDPSAQSNGGDLGWFKAFKMVYPFESAAYNTELNAVSEPFRTRFGYHIVQPTERRKSRGDITAAHIMVSLKQQDPNINPEKRINEIYALLEQGESFSVLARTYSDDKKTAKKGGALNRFSSGQLSSVVFEDAVFALEENGSYTKPFKTAFGWHIGQLIQKHPVGNYEQMKFELENRVKRDQRAKIISDSLIVKLLKKYKIKKNKKAADFFNTLVSNDVLKGAWELDRSIPELKEVFLKVNDTIFTNLDVANFMEESQKKSRKYPNKEAYISDKLVTFRNSRLTAYHQNNLAKEDPEFAALFKEYQEGLLLFDLMETKVWNIAKTDSVGLQKYHKENAQKYAWPRRMEVIIATASKKADANKARTMLADGKSTKEIADAMNASGQVKIIFSTKTIPQNDNSLVSEYSPQLGLSPVYSKDGFVFYQVLELLPEGLKSIDEARGQVISDYQKDVEKRWLTSLRNQAKIKVKKKTLKKLEAKLKQ